MKHVALLWTIVLLVFGLFNAVYWPVVMHQASTDPLNFLDRAQVLYAIGETDEATAWLRRGIFEHRPPSAEPYRLLHEWYALHSQPDAARAQEPQVAFYEGLSEAGPALRAKRLQRAVVQTLALEPAPNVAPETALAVDTMSRFFGALFGVETMVEQWSLPEKVALLRLTGGPIVRGRVIGQTNVVSPVDILVQSGGGAGPARTARILAGERHYEGGQRGFHVMLLDAASGGVQFVMAFDTWQSEEEAARMTAFLKNADPGVIGIFAVLDDVSAHLDTALEAQLLNFGLYRGARVERQLVILGERFSFAAIGVKGASAGTALQTWSPDDFLGTPGHPVALGVVRDLGGAS